MKRQPKGQKNGGQFARDISGKDKVPTPAPKVPRNVQRQPEITFCPHRIHMGMNCECVTEAAPSRHLQYCRCGFPYMTDRGLEIHIRQEHATEPDLRLVEAEVPCAKCGRMLRVKHFAHATVSDLAPRYHLACASSVFPT